MTERGVQVSLGVPWRRVDIRARRLVERDQVVILVENLCRRDSDLRVHAGQRPLDGKLRPGARRRSTVARPRPIGPQPTPCDQLRRGVAAAERRRDDVEQWSPIVLWRDGETDGEGWFHNNKETRRQGDRALVRPLVPSSSYLHVSVRFARHTVCDNTPGTRRS